MNYGEVQEYNRLHKVVGVIEEGGQLIEVHEDSWQLSKPPANGMVVELSHERVDGHEIYSAIREVDKPRYFGWEEPDRFWFSRKTMGFPKISMLCSIPMRPLRSYLADGPLVQRTMR